MSFTENMITSPIIMNFLKTDYKIGNVLKTQNQ